MPSKIAVTGGIGSGKSTVCRILQEQGYPVFSCDEINRTLWQEKDYLDGLRTRFPSCFPDGKPDKKALSALVFSDRKALERLNAYAHPRIYARLKEQMESVGRDCFAEVPLLFESGMTELFDGVIVVLRSKEERMRSAAARDGITLQEAQERIAKQFDYDGRLPRGCFLVRNDGDEASLSEKTLALLPLLKKKNLLA